MTAFGQYANYYDELYSDKDYPVEAAFVERLILRHSQKARTILDLGCGSARHAIELVQKGYSVTGVDISPQMVQLALNRLRGLPSEMQAQLKVVEGDVTKYASASTYDVVTALFHVACYQTSDDALKALFQTARAALDRDGIFIFDFWYGPAVLADRPQPRVKRVNKPGCSITRLAEPVMATDRHVVEVAYTLTVVDEQTGRAEEIHELHAMRYLFLPELESLAAGVGLELVETGQWLSDAALDANSWLGYAVARVRS